MCALCFTNDSGDEKRCIFHCTNLKLVEIRKIFIPDRYEKFAPYPDDNSANDILHIILRGSSTVNCSRVGRFLSYVLDLLIEMERNKWSSS